MMAKKVKMAPSRASTHASGNRQTETDTGMIRRARAAMKLAAKAPCAECPLRRDSAAGHLGGYSPAMYIEVLHGPASLACHSSKGFAIGDVGEQRHCTGVAAFRANVGHVAQIDGHETGAHRSTLAIGEDRETYFATDAEFVAHHSKGQR